jgi:hypothetical protein
LNFNTAGYVTGTWDNGDQGTFYDECRSDNRTLEEHHCIVVDNKRIIAITTHEYRNHAPEASPGLGGFCQSS